MANQAAPKFHSIKPWGSFAFASGIWISICIGALLPWLLEIPNRLDAALLATTAAIFALGITQSTYRGLYPIGLVTSIFAYSWLVIGPAFQLSRRQVAWGDYALLQQSDHVTFALVLTCLSALAFFASRTPRFRGRMPSKGPVRINASAVWIYLVILTVITPYALAVNGGVAGFFASRGDRFQALSSQGISIAQSGGIQIALAVILPAALSTAAAYLSISAGLSDRNVRKSQPFRYRKCAIALSLAYATLYTNPLANTRYIFLLMIGSCIFAALRPRRRASALITSGLLLVLTSLAYPASRLLWAVDSGTSSDFLDVFAGPDFDGFQQIVNTDAYVDSRGHTWGRYILSAILFFVPRSAWGDKATPAAIDVAEFRGYWFTNLSMPFHSELYLEFGLAGTVLILATLGAVSKRFDQAWLNAWPTRGALLSPVVAFASFGILRGPMGSLAPIYLTVIILVALGTFYSREDRRPPHRNTVRHMLKYQGSLGNRASKSPT